MKNYIEKLTHFNRFRYLKKRRRRIILGYLKKRIQNNSVWVALQ